MLKEPSPTSESASCTQETESSPECGAEIVDPRVFRLGAQITQSDDARLALMAWYKACRADLQLDPREEHRTGLEASLTHDSTVKGYPSALARDLETVGPGKSSCMAGQVGAQAASKDLSHGDEMTAQELRFSSEQEDLKGRWLMARQKRCKDRKRRPSGLH